MDAARYTAWLAEIAAARTVPDLLALMRTLGSLGALDAECYELATIALERATGEIRSQWWRAGGPGT